VLIFASMLGCYLVPFPILDASSLSVAAVAASSRMACMQAWLCTPIIILSKHLCVVARKKKLKGLFGCLGFGGN